MRKPDAMPPRLASHGPVRASICGRTHRGRVRADNQDHLLVVDLGRGALSAHSAGEASRGSAVGPLEFQLERRGAVLLVADGMGGRAGGARASGIAVAAVSRVMADGAGDDGTEPDAFVECLRSALDEANREIREEAERDSLVRGMGTTATLAGIRGGVVYVAQVGDSRAYLVREGSVTRLTRDQSLVQDLIDAGVLDEGRTHGVRKNVILQALGVTESVHPEVTYHDLRRGDVLLLCSDGLSHVVRDDEILRAVTESADCLSMCDRLVGAANDRGGPDNVTVLAARIDGDGLELPAPSDVVGRRVWARSP